MKIVALVVFSIVAATMILVGSSYLAIYYKLFLYSISDRPMTTLAFGAAAALILLLGRNRVVLEKWLPRRARRS
jgi:hypothetical protein